MVGIVVFGWRVAHALAGDAMHHNGVVQFAGSSQGAFHLGNVMSINGTEIGQPKVLEQCLARPWQGGEMAGDAAHSR